ncbi:MAG: hypothetical protein Q8K32_11145 [Archangium sp.]|nr:hypothetical protein [Archangium sp.]
MDEVVSFLVQVRRDVAAGSTLVEAVADGTLLGWRAREAINSCLNEPVANWDRERGRTKGERLALLARVLGELGVAPHRGGWNVGGGR